MTFQLWKELSIKNRSCCAQFFPFKTFHALSEFYWKLHSWDEWWDLFAATIHGTLNIIYVKNFAFCSYGQVVDNLVQVSSSSRLCNDLLSCYITAKKPSNAQCLDVLWMIQKKFQRQSTLGRNEWKPIYSLQNFPTEWSEKISELFDQVSIYSLFRWMKSRFNG